MQKPLIIVLALLAFAAGITAGVTWRSAPLTLAHGTLLEPPRAVAPFSLRSAADPALTDDDLRGQWTLVFFGFTHCPDICPATLQLLKTVRERLSETLPPASLPSVLLVSVDPARDDVATLDAYTAYFGDGFSGATADEPALTRFATDLGIVFMRVDLDDSTYTMDHSGAVLLFDPDATLAAVFSPPLSAAGIAADLEKLLEHRS